MKITLIKNEPLAQAVEHLTFNQRVTGSIPVWLTFILFRIECEELSILIICGRGGMADALG